MAVWMLNQDIFETPILDWTHFISFKLHSIVATMFWLQVYTGCVHTGTNYVPKDGSDRDPLRDWYRDLNYVRSHALQTPSQSQTGSAHCEVIFCSYCLTHAWLQLAFPKCTHESRSERALRLHVLESGFLRGSRSKTPFFRVSKAWFERALRSQRVKSGFQIRKGPKRLSEHDSFSCEQAHCRDVSHSGSHSRISSVLVHTLLSIRAISQSNRRPLDYLSWLLVVEKKFLALSEPPSCRHLGFIGQIELLLDRLTKSDQAEVQAWRIYGNIRPLG